MSAFILNTKHIAYMILAATHWGAWANIDGEYKTLGRTDIQACGDILYWANYKSVNARYSESATAPSVDWVKEVVKIGKIDPVQVIKACNCFDYQSCEFDGYEISTASKLCDAIRHAAMRNLIGYENAQWEIR